MKRILMFLMTMCLVLGLCAALTSCGHECAFSTDWSKDATHHWHACTVADCTEVSDRADHDWDEGAITTAATQDADGTKTFTCKTCAETKTEAVSFTGMTTKQWSFAFTLANFQNFTYKEAASTKGNGVTVDTEVIYKITKNGAWAKISVAGQSEESTFDSYSASQLRDQLLASITSLASHSDYTYDPNTKTYKANKKIEIASLNASSSDITLKFEDEKLVELKYSVEFTQNSIPFTATSTVTLSDYGTTVIN